MNSEGMCRKSVAIMISLQKENKHVLEIDCFETKLFGKSNFVVLLKVFLRNLELKIEFHHENTPI